jgi:anti-sigma factor RsiW
MDSPVSCADAQAVIEQMVDQTVPSNRTDDAVASHVERCDQCAASLALARRVDRLLAAAQAPAAPSGMVPAVLLRVSAERWRTDQVIDRWFTGALVAGLVLAVGGLTALFNLAGLTAGALEAVGALSLALPEATDRVATVLPNYGAALAVVLTAYGIWWWTDGRFERSR